MLTVSFWFLMSGVGFVSSSGVITWQQAYEAQLATSPLEASATLSPNSNFETLGFGRTFYPKPYTSSAVQHTLVAPWATEYFILPY